MRIKEYIEKTIQVEETKSIICNKCGKTLSADDEMYGTYMVMDPSWGYNSRKDGEFHHSDICEDCYDAFVKTFVHPVNISQREEI